MSKELIEKKIQEITEIAQKIQQRLAEQQQQFIACQGALEVLEDLLKSCTEEKTNKEGDAENEQQDK